MRKKLRRIAALGGSLVILWGGAAGAADDTDLEQLKQQIQQLIRQNQMLIRENRQLNKRITTIEQAMQQPTPAADAAVSSSVPTGLLRTRQHQVILKEAREKSTEAPPEEVVTDSTVPEKLLRTKVHQAVRQEMRQEMEEEGREQKINKYVTLFGLIEFEGTWGSDYNDDSFSEFNVATGQLGFDAQISDWALGHLLALYEGPDDQTLTLDEANIWIGNYEKFPALLTAGKFYMPFGKFETNMIQDPMTHYIGEINDYGVAAGFKTSGFFASLFTYNGMKERENQNTITGFGAKIGYELERDDFSLNTAVGWVNDMADADSIGELFDEYGLETIHDQVNGFCAHLIASRGPVSFIGEYITALDDFYPGRFNPETGKMEGSELLYKGQGARPAAWNIELSWSTELWGKSTVLAVGYQGTQEAVALGLPDYRFLGVASMVVLPGTTLSLEYFHDRDYDGDEDGSGNSADVVTTQLAYEF
jgi:hypothetical protein